MAASTTPSSSTKPKKAKTPREEKEEALRKEIETRAAAYDQRYQDARVQRAINLNFQKLVRSGLTAGDAQAEIDRRLGRARSARLGRAGAAAVPGATTTVRPSVASRAPTTDELRRTGKLGGPLLSREAMIRRQPRLGLPRLTLNSPLAS